MNDKQVAECLVKLAKQLVSELNTQDKRSLDKEIESAIEDAVVEGMNQYNKVFWKALQKTGINHTVLDKAGMTISEYYGDQKLSQKILEAIQEYLRVDYESQIERSQAPWA